MSFDKFLSNVLDELADMEEVKQNYLDDNCLFQTRLNFFSNENQPGFFTPWWEKNKAGNTMGFSDAGRELVFKVNANFLLIAGNLIQLFKIPFEDDETLSASKAACWSACFVGTLYYSVNFVLEFVLCLTAIITRSVASFVLVADSTLANLVEQFAAN